jgi:ubiquinone biosynthesis monooxygenase Coq7
MSDAWILALDQALRTLWPPPRAQGRPCARPMPGAQLPDAQLSDRQRRHAAGLMRVNHSGEICAQALYQGQALLSAEPALTAILRQAAEEEAEHLDWSAQRIDALGGRVSGLNPLWYGGAFAMGLIAGASGRRWNLGFLAETERQVEAHLDDHLARWPAADPKSRAVLEQMRADEMRHADRAEKGGAAALPWPLRQAMRASAGVMTRLAYWI